MQDMEYSMRKPLNLNFEKFLPSAAGAAATSGEPLANGSGRAAPSASRQFPGASRGGHNKPMLDDEAEFPPIYTQISAPAQPPPSKWSFGSAKLKGNRAGGKRVAGTAAAASLAAINSAQRETPEALTPKSSAESDDVTIATGSYAGANGNSGRGLAAATVAGAEESASGQQ